MKIMQVLGLGALLGTSGAGCADSSNFFNNKSIVKYQPDITIAQFEQISDNVHGGPFEACDGHVYWQQQADRVVLGEQAEAIYKKGVEDAMAGKGLLSGKEIKAKMLELFDAGYKTALEAAKNGKK